MQKLIKKITAVIITTILVTANLMPVLSYASEAKVQNAKTTEENVEFNATINNEYSTSLDVDSEGSLDLSVKVSETGYLKESEVILEGNNFELINREGLNVKSIEGNVIKLNEVNVGEMLKVSLPFKLNKQERVTSDVLGKDSTVTFNGVYVNENGKERKIKKTLTEHLEWTAEPTEVVSQELIRYIKYDENKTMISFKIKDGIQDNKMPVTNKEITIDVPSLKETKPSNVIVTGNGISYTYENDVVTIKKENTPDSEGKIKWNSDDEYVVTYIYDVQSEEKLTVESGVTAKVQVKGNTIEGTLDNKTYELDKQVGQFVEAEAYGTQEINKGYMYTNLKSDENNFETAFEVRLKENVGFKDITDTLKIVETTAQFNELNASNSLKDRKVKIEKDNLVKILGEDGFVKVLTADGKELGILTKDSLELDVDQDKIVLETSKVVSEGDLEIIISKVITSNKEFNKDQIKDFNELTINATVEGYKDEKVNSSKEVTYKANLVEPTSNAQIDLSVNNLSTIVENENVVITATLETNDISDALYSNAKINIVLPEEVKDIEIKESGLIYEDELKLENLQANGNVISLNLSGTQTKYSSQSTANGTVVRLVTDLTLDNLAPTNEKVVTLNYNNEATGEEKSVDEVVKIIAPTGFVATNSLELNGEKVTSQESEEKTIKLNVNDIERTAKVEATVVNNLGKDVEGFTILGTIPTSGNKDASGIDLKSNFDTVLASEIKVEGIDAQVFYSENTNETVDGTTWTNTYSQNAKSYKIVANGTVAQISSMKFSYDLKVPANLTYGKTAKASYSVFYNNDAEEGTTMNYVVAKSVGMTTGEVPDVSAEGILIDTNTGAIIDNESNVKEGKFLTYRLNVVNTGKEDITNVKTSIDLPEGIAIVGEIYDMSDLPIYTYDAETKNISNTIEKLIPGETKTLEYRLVVTQKVIELEDGMEIENKEDLNKKTISASVTADKVKDKVTTERTINIVKGDLSASVTSNKTGKGIKIGDIVEYYLNINNANYEEKTNIVATVILPKELKVTSASYDDASEYDYDEKTNVITYKKAKLDPGASDGLYIVCEVSNIDNNTQTVISAKIKCDQMDKEDTLEPIKIGLVKNVVSISQSSNIAEGNISDTDDLEYYIDVKNNTDEKITVDLSDTLPTELRVLGYETQDANGRKLVETNSRTIIASLEINSGETGRLLIRTEPYSLARGRVSKIENKATAEILELSISGETNILKHTIVGTSQNSAGSSTKPEGTPSTGDENLENEVGKEGTYRISGTVWFDENANGRKEDIEQRMSGLTVKLINRETGKTALDIDGKELVKTTNGLGTYTFINVVPGNYIVVVEYDNSGYVITSYKVQELAESENSDFISTKLDGKEVAATDELIISNENIYNIDLGLVRSKIFDLDINKSVTRISVTNTKEDTKVYDFDNKAITKVELASRNVDFATVLVEYTIRIENNGQVAGYAKSIVDYVPEGMTFSSELNSSWYLGRDGNAYNTSLANTLINPGEVKEVKLVLSRKMSGENTGTVRNTAEILTSYNEYGLTDIDANSGNVQDVAEKSGADVVIGMSTGREIASFTGIALGILSIIAVTVYEIKKHVISKMYNFMERR